MTVVQHQSEVTSGERFQFGDNWLDFSTELSDDRIRLAEKSLVDALGGDSLAGRRFLDAGSGSGLFSLAARRLGATVHSFDFDPASVECTRRTKEAYLSGDQRWSIEQGSILDDDYVRSLGQFDIVYSWGVLHHTGNLARALDNAIDLVAPEGTLYIALYNDQGGASRRWLRVKQAYNRLPSRARWLVVWPAACWLWTPTMLLDALRGRPFHSWRSYAERSRRGMSAWHDVVDWVGGLPFEVAKPETVLERLRRDGFTLEWLITCAGGLGCNEYVFRRQ